MGVVHVLHVQGQGHVFLQADRIHPSTTWVLSTPVFPPFN